MLPSTVGYRTMGPHGSGGQFTPPAAQNDSLHQFQMNRLQFVQYECLKTELKEEYEKRVNFLHKRIEMRQAQQGPYQDAHLILMQNNMGDPRNAKRNSERAGANKYGGSLTNFNSPMNDQFFLPGMKSRDARTQYDKGGFQNKTLNEGVISSTKRRATGGKDGNKQHSQEREQYYKFYLDSAQKAIEMMRKQHKSASIMKMSSEPISGGQRATGHVGVLPHVAPQSQSQYGMYPTKGNDSFKNFDNISNGGHNSSLSPLAYVEGHGSPAKSGTGTNQGQRGGRLLEPLFGQQNRLATTKHVVTKSGGMSALTQQDEGELDSQNVPSFVQPKMQMIQEDGDGHTALSSAQLQTNKPFSAAHGTRTKRPRDGHSDQRYGAMSKQSTQFTGGGAGLNRGVLGMSGATSGHYDNIKPPRQRMSSIPGMSRSTQKNFQPLRHQGRLGHVQLSNDRHGGLPSNIDHIGMMPDANYKSVGEFQNNPAMAREGLFKSKSQAK